MFWLFSLLRCDLEYTCFWLDYSELRSVNIFRRCCSMKLFICSKTPRPDSEWQASNQLAVAGFLNKKTLHPLKPRSATVSPPSTPRAGCLSSVLQLHTACTLLKHIWSGSPFLFTLPPLWSRDPNARSFLICMCSRSPVVPRTISASCSSLFHTETCPVCYNWSLWPLPSSLISRGALPGGGRKGGQGRVLQGCLRMGVSLFASLRFSTGFSPLALSKCHPSSLQAWGW